MTIDKSKPILVTGGSGYIASWIIRYLLEDGLNVRATVRSKANPKKVAHLMDLQKGTEGNLELFEADLMQDGSFDEAVKGCELIMHTASPFFLKKPKDVQKELIGPAELGTQSVLDSATKVGGVKRIVLTSSVAAIYSDSVDITDRPGEVFDEEQWNTESSLEHNAYSYSKTLAEKKAWELKDKQSEWDLVVINPSFVLGPSLSNRKDSESVEFMRSMVNGKFAPGVADIWMGVVDVRDVAKSHILAGLNSEAAGRHILCAKAMDMLSIANVLREKFGNKYKIPKSTVPKFLLYMVGPIIAGLSWKWIGKNYGVSIQFDNSKSQKGLGVQYKPVEQTLTEHIDQLQSSGLI